MRTLELKFLEGANYWSDQSLLAGLLELPTLENLSIAEIPNIHSLIADLPAPHPSDPAAQDVANRLAIIRLGREPAIRLPEHIARILLGLTGAHATFARTAPASLHCYHVVLGVDDPILDRDCIDTAWTLLCRALNGLPNETAAILSALMARANDERLGPSTWSLVRAAEQRGIPTARLSDSHSLIQLGWGNRQHRLWTSETITPARSPPPSRVTSSSPVPFSSVLMFLFRRARSFAPPPRPGTSPQHWASPSSSSHATPIEAAGSQPAFPHASRSNPPISSPLASACPSMPMSSSNATFSESSIGFSSLTAE